jgi:hypothetical protein
VAAPHVILFKGPSEDFSLMPCAHRCVEALQEAAEKGLHNFCKHLAPGAAHSVHTIKLKPVTICHSSSAWHLYSDVVWHIDAAR